ncbi:hypothetical protein NCC78_03070 [Micromonospora phytophila]|nr:hypothetical protein [Micromonospora phytophila]
MERNWFQHCMAEQPREQIAGNTWGDDARWEVTSVPAGAAPPGNATAPSSQPAAATADRPADSSAAGHGPPRVSVRLVTRPLPSSRLGSAVRRSCFTR